MKTSLIGSDPLYDRLTEIIEEARKLGGAEKLFEPFDAPGMPLNVDTVLKLHGWSEGLATLIIADSRFPGDAPRLIRGEGGSSGFYPNFVGTGLVRKALESGDALDAINWLLKVLGTQSAEGNSIEAVWGVPVNERIELTPEVTLVPIDNVPDCEQKRWAQSIAYSGLHAVSHSPLTMVPPSSALIRHRVIQPFLTSGGETTSAQAEEQREYLETHKLFQQIVAVLTIIGPRVALPFAHWFTYDDPDLQRASIMGGSRSYSLMEILPWSIEQYPSLDPVEARALIKAYLALPSSIQDVLTIGIQRINQALRRRGAGDRAVELCTALEAMVGDNDNSEMTHKVKVRATRLVGGAPKERLMNAKRLNLTYSIRSKLVHKGKVDEQKKEWIGDRHLTRAEIVKETVLIAIELVKRLINRGSIPDWTEFDVLEHAPQEMGTHATFP